MICACCDNNSGKSHILDLAGALCENKFYRTGWEFHCRGVLDEASLRRHFQENTSGGDLAGDHWHQHGAQLVSKEVIWNTDKQAKVTNVVLTDPPMIGSHYGGDPAPARLLRLRDLLSTVRHEFSGKRFRRLLADRDIRPEGVSKELALSSDGFLPITTLTGLIVSKPAHSFLKHLCPRNLTESAIML